MNESLTAFLVCFIITMFLIGVGYGLGSAESERIINELCNKQEYDFCVLKEKTYVLKGNADE